MERGVLILNRPMPMASTPVVDGRLRPSKARPPCLTRHPPMTLAASRPIEREAQKVKGGRTFTPLLRLRRTPKGQQAGFVRMEGQSIHSHPLSQQHQHPLRIVLAFESKNEVITIPDEEALPPEVWLDFGFYPEIEDIIDGLRRFISIFKYEKDYTWVRIPVGAKAKDILATCEYELNQHTRNELLGEKNAGAGI